MASRETNDLVATALKVCIRADQKRTSLLLREHLTGQPVPATASDTMNTMAAFLGASRTGRIELVEQAAGQALRAGQWKFIEASKRPRMNVNTNTELGNDAVPQLYDLAVDPGETRNVADAYPERVKEMAALLQKIRSQGGAK